MFIGCPGPSCHCFSVVGTPTPPRTSAGKLPSLSVTFRAAHCLPVQPPGSGASTRSFSCNSLLLTVGRTKSSNCVNFRHHGFAHQRGLPSELQRPDGFPQHSVCSGANDGKGGGGGRAHVERSWSRSDEGLRTRVWKYVLLNGAYRGHGRSEFAVAPSL